MIEYQKTGITFTLSDLLQNLDKRNSKRNRKRIHTFFYKQHFYTVSKARLKLAKNQVNAKQNHEIEL